MFNRIEHRLVVVDQWSPRPFPPVKAFIRAGLPVGVAARWIKVRREMSPAGLTRKLQSQRN